MAFAISLATEYTLRQFDWLPTGTRDNTWQALADGLRKQARSDFVDPLGGDVEAAVEIAEAFAAVLKGETAGASPPSVPPLP